MRTVEDLFRAVAAWAEAGFAGGWDGLFEWQEIKRPLSGARPLGGSWLAPWDDDTRAAILLLPESDGGGRLIEANHFQRQTARIPVEEPLCLRRLIQVALNVGQLEAAGKPLDVPPGYAACSWYVGPETSGAALSDLLDGEAIAALARLLE